MPARPPLANTAKIEMQWSLSGGAKATNIFYLLGTHDFSQSELQSITTVLDSHLTSPSANNFVTPLGDNAALINWVAIDNSGATDNFYSSSVSHSGGQSSGLSPANCAVGVSFAIAARYRGGKPRWYLPGVCTAILNGTNINQFSSSFITTETTAVQGFVNAVNADSTITGGLTVGTISFQTGKAPRPTPLWRTFTGVTIHPRVDSQRRRLGKEVGVL